MLFLTKRVLQNIKLIFYAVTKLFTIQLLVDLLGDKISMIWLRLFANTFQPIAKQIFEQLYLMIVLLYQRNQCDYIKQLLGTTPFKNNPTY